MKLYSEQSYDLSITRDPRKRKLGTYADTPRIAHAQAKLYDELLGTDQVIWCLLEPPSHAEIVKWESHVVLENTL